MGIIGSSLKYLNGEMTLSQAEDLTSSSAVSDGIKFLERCKINKNNVKEQTLFSVFFRARLHLNKSPLKYREMRNIMHMELYFSRTTKEDILLGFDAIYEKETARRKNKDSNLTINLEDFELVFRPFSMRKIVDKLDVFDDFTHNNITVIIPDELKYIDGLLIEEGK